MTIRPKTYDLARPFALAALGSALALVAAPAAARPTGPDLFCGEYPTSPGCMGQTVSCDTCHAGQPNLNAYGLALGSALWADPAYAFDAESYVARLPAAFSQVEAPDSDGDGLSNLEEIELGTFPGDEQSHWTAPAAPEGLENPFYKLGEYDPAFAFRRLSITYCGISPSFEEMEAFKQASDQEAALHDKLDACTGSDFWRKEALHRLADNRIRPLKAVGQDGDIMLADYSWDYQLFSYVLTDGRDARDLLLADYHVDADGDVVNGTIAKLPGSLLGTPIRVGTGQPLNAQYRAGMITTQWFLVVNTMFSPMPRTTAAQAYRAYLGQDIAKGEGIHPVAGEPRDVDGKGVAAPTCAACHSTLDPLAYAFADYNGIEIALFGNPTGNYDNGRTPWGEDGVLFGEPVGSLTEWAQTAANSDEFKRNLANMFWDQALDHGPLPGDKDDFATLWQALPQDGYSADALLHRFIDTDAFGAP